MSSLSHNISGLPTFEERIERGLKLGRAEHDEIIPFPDDWCKDQQLLGLQSGPSRKLVYQRINENWALTLYQYRTSTGTLVLVILRLDPPSREGERKLILPLTVERLCGIVPTVRFKSLEPLRPLFALPELATRPESQVLMVEGEGGFGS